MIKVTAPESFCDMKLVETTGKGEKKLYLSKISTISFIENYLDIKATNGHNIYSYNDEVRVRTRGLRGYITKDNLSDYFDETIHEYQNISKYRTNLERLENNNRDFLRYCPEKIYFDIDCSISKERIYIGSQDDNWHNTIPAFSIPRDTKVEVTRSHKSNEVEFKLI